MEAWQVQLLAFIVGWSIMPFLRVCWRMIDRIRISTPTCDHAWRHENGVILEPQKFFKGAIGLTNLDSDTAGNRYLEAKYVFDGACGKCGLTRFDRTEREQQEREAKEEETRITDKARIAIQYAREGKQLPREVGALSIPETTGGDLSEPELTPPGGIIAFGIAARACAVSPEEIERLTDQLKAQSSKTPPNESDFSSALIMPSPGKKTSS